MGIDGIRIIHRDFVDGLVAGLMVSRVPVSPTVSLRQGPKGVEIWDSSVETHAPLAAFPFERLLYAIQFADQQAHFPDEVGHWMPAGNPPPVGALHYFPAVSLDEERPAARPELPRVRRVTFELRVLSSPNEWAVELHLVLGPLDVTARVRWVF